MAGALAAGAPVGPPALPPLQFEVEYEDLRNLVVRLKLDPNEEQDLINDVLSAISAAEDHRKTRLEKIQKVRDRFYLETPNRTPPIEGGANWHIPFMRWVLESSHARLWGSIFGSPNWVMVTGIKGMADVDLAGRVEGFLHYVNSQELDLPAVYDDGLERILTDGFVMIKNPWERRVQKIKRRRLEEQRIELSAEEAGAAGLDILADILAEDTLPAIKILHRYTVDEREEEVYHGPRAQVCTLDNFIVPNPNVSRPEDQPWKAQQFWMSRDQLWRERRHSVVLDGVEQDVGRWEHIDQIVTFHRREDTSSSGTESRVGAQEGVATAVTTPDLVGELRCYEIIWPYRAWKMARYPSDQVPDPDRLAERVILTISADEKHVLLEGIEYPWWDPNPEDYWVKAEVIGKEGRWYSYSLGEICMPVQDELDTIHWQRSDVTTVILLSFLTFLAEEGAADQLEKIKLGQRNVVDSIDGIKLLADVIKVTLQAPGVDIETLVLRFGELLTAVSEPTLGVPSAGDKTAFEIGTVVRSGALKYTKMQGKLGESIIKIDKINLRRYAQFYPLVAPKVYRVSGGDDPIRELSLRELDVDPDLMVRAQTIGANRELEAAKAIRVLQMGEQNIFMRVALLGNPAGIYHLLSTFLQQMDYPGGPEVVLGAKGEALKNITAGTQVLAMMMGLAGLGGGAGQGNGDRGPNLALLKPLQDLLNKSGIGSELAALGQQASAGGVNVEGR